MAELVAERHDLDIDTALDKHPDFGTCSVKDLLKDMADHEAGLTGSRPWREVRAEVESDAVHR